MFAKSGTDTAITLALLLVGAICEVSGGWAIWKWRRDGWHWLFLILGCFLVITSGVLPTFQKQEFARTYAVYGGFFISVSYLWGWALNGTMPDIWDGIGSAISLGGVLLAMFAPRSSSQA